MSAFVARTNYTERLPADALGFGESPTCGEADCTPEPNRPTSQIGPGALRTGFHRDRIET